MIISLHKLWLAWSKFGENIPTHHAYRSFYSLGLAAMLFGGLVLAGSAILGVLRDFNTDAGPAVSAKSAAVSAVSRALAADEVHRLQTVNAALSRQLLSLAPDGRYLVIDTAGNRVYMRRGEKDEAEMVASCGSGNVLEDPKGGRRWVFDTPRGRFTIQSKLTDPIWMKPDWAYIEEGEEIPRNPADRAEPGMMGDYALGIGQGYFIHGTLYTRLLGRNVSHGCVRLGAEDLARLYRLLPVGARVVIF